MTLFKNKYRVESARLQGYDYGSPGEYYVTINTRGRIRWFGDVVDGGMKRNDVGNIVQKCWLSIPAHHLNVELDEFVIMPDHVHGIITIIKQIERDVARNVSPQHHKHHRIPSPQPGSLPTIVRSFKSAVSNEIHRAGHADFAWQPRYYDHIIRDEDDLNRIREYIINNPLMWYYTKTNPRFVKIQYE